MKQIVKEQKRIIASLFEKKEILKKWNIEYSKAIQYKRQSKKILEDFLISILCLLFWAGALFSTTEIFLTIMFYIMATLVTPISLFPVLLRSKRKKWLTGRQWDIVPLEKLEELLSENQKNIQEIERELLERNDYLESCTRLIEESTGEVQETHAVKKPFALSDTNLDEQIEIKGKIKQLTGKSSK